VSGDTGGTGGKPVQLKGSSDDVATDVARVLDGVRAIHDQALDMIASLGFRRHDETGIPFDPGLHEVVRVEPYAEEPAGIVVEVVRPGYGEGDGQLRPAAVVVAGGHGR